MAENETSLIDSNEYLKSGIHIGTKFKTKYMSSFIYKTRPDGLSVLNLKKIDERVAELVGIILGDGHLHTRNNQITIVGSIEDFECDTGNTAAIIYRCIYHYACIVK